MEPKVIKNTFIHFIEIYDEKTKLKDFIKMIKFEYAGFTTNFEDSNYIKFNIDLDENHIYYNEIIEFYTTKNSKFPSISCEYPLYPNKVNNIYIDLDFEKEEKSNEKNISIEMIYQTINKELLPNSIIYDNKEISCFDTFQNKFRKRIGLINVKPNKLSFIKDIYEQYPDFKFDNEMFI